MDVFAIDNLDKTNHTDINVMNKSLYCLHIGAIKAVLNNLNRAATHSVRIPRPIQRWHEGILDPRTFVDGFIPTEDDAEISTFVAMFISAVHPHQDRLSTDYKNSAMYITHLLQYLLEGFRT